MSILFTLMFTLVPLFIVVVFVIVIGTFAANAFKGIAQWQDNNARPAFTVSARVVAKRLQVSGGGNDTSASTWYYVTFETVADGLRQEFSVRSNDYSGLAEGDTGELTHQGTRFKGFARVLRPPVPPPAPVPERTCGYCGAMNRNVDPKCPACGAMGRAATVSTTE